jgi:hypothetical protein
MTAARSTETPPAPPGFRCLREGFLLAQQCETPAGGDGRNGKPNKLMEACAWGAGAAAASEAVIGLISGPEAPAVFLIPVLL